MAFNEYLVLTILANLFIGISSSLAWNPNTQRSYDLERGPVFYEAYYPDGNEEPRSNYQEKRYFDRGMILEQSYQVPSESHNSAQNGFRINEYQNAPDKLSVSNSYREERRLPESSMQSRGVDDFHSTEQYQARENFLPGTIGSTGADKPYHPFSGLSGNSMGNEQSLGIKEISSIARRAISRDLENWNMIENYLNRAAKYQDQSTSYRSQQIADSAPPVYNTLVETLRETNSGRITQENRQPITNHRDTPVLGTLTNPSRNSFDPYDTNRYENQRQNDWPSQGRSENLVTIAPPFSSQPNLHASEKQSSLSSYPPENIFEPRPQVINYVFSEKPKTTDVKSQNISLAKEVSKDSVPRNYGDNLIRDEIKKSDDSGNVKVTSIEVSEVPRHKTRHHHGEWPRRDYSHRH